MTKSITTNINDSTFPQYLWAFCHERSIANRGQKVNFLRLTCGKVVLMIISVIFLGNKKQTGKRG